MITRRKLLQGLASGTAFVAANSLRPQVWGSSNDRSIARPLRDEDLFRYIRRQRGKYDATVHSQILGAANEFKEGDEIVGVAAHDAASRTHARTLLSRTRLSDLDASPLHADGVYRLAESTCSETARSRTANWTLDRLKNFLLASDETAIKQIMPGLSSDVIACVVKLMGNDELIQIGRKVFNPLPGSQIGARGYLGARIQPNSPTDNVDDIRWQVFDGWAYGVGDVLLGTNPVSSEPQSVAAIEETLRDLLITFEIADLMPHCVLAHIDVQAEVERKWPGSTALWFQSIAGTDDANATFDISVEKMTRLASSRDGHYGLYFETGQGADFTNGHGHGFDMVIHESRKYGFARALAAQVAAARGDAGEPPDPWVHLNDVAGFIGPEVFRTREQLVRCCLEDIAMGKLHGLCLGLDVCSTLHMDVSLDDLDWCLDEILPANPAYLMALPTKIDPMLGYLTTGYQDHVRLRDRFGYRVNDSIWSFFQQLGIIRADGRPGRHFGDPVAVFLQYRRRKGDTRDEARIREEGRQQLDAVRRRGVFVAEGYGDRPWELDQKLRTEIQRIYEDAKLSIWAELNPQFITQIPNCIQLATRSANRSDYILHPATGERLDEPSVTRLRQLRDQQSGRIDVQIVISDGLNALSIMEDNQLLPFLDNLRRRLHDEGTQVSPDHLLVTSGRVRAGYRIGEILFADLEGPRAVLHVIGERPGTGHRTFSTYITAPAGDIWGQAGTADHNMTKVVSGIATTALQPEDGAKQVCRLLGTMLAAPT